MQHSRINPVSRFKLMINRTSLNEWLSEQASDDLSSKPSPKPCEFIHELKMSLVDPFHFVFLEPVWYKKSSTCKPCRQVFALHDGQKFSILQGSQALFWLITQSFLFTGEERLRDEPKECLQGRLKFRRIFCIRSLPSSVFKLIAPAGSTKKLIVRFTCWTCWTYTKAKICLSFEKFLSVLMSKILLVYLECCCCCSFFSLYSSRVGDLNLIFWYCNA